MELGELIKSAREGKGLLMRELAANIEVDIAQISRFEKGDRRPTKEQILKLIDVLELDKEEVLTLWLSNKIINDVEGEEVALQALKLAQNRIKKRKH
ncbi:helix-turn-helix domain-containing protein [Allomuricauda sp. ARW1Y1]|jgi:transcriptional regulator with XRE-family HTH domain|uniref:helix-turn-helix domain-containing protein n=1 Tax=Allomuricauda sp. ARW1Y1 TaxID=2663843 RepID=UPI0015CC674A|nr:helix-turn-helix transcriptional regulator [Muricauda sp. ARW1Y1]NYJ28239.1 transcriptional regulator with XRE-family HTH domain [Muricauda sp. ARW1Y1]